MPSLSQASRSQSYLHDEASVDEPRSLRDAEVGATELHQAVVVQNLKGKEKLAGLSPLIPTCGKAWT